MYYFIPRTTRTVITRYAGSLAENAGFYQLLWIESAWLNCLLSIPDLNCLLSIPDLLFSVV